MLFTLLPLAGWAYDEVKFQIGDTPLNPATIDQTKADDPTDPNSVYLIYNALEKDTPIPAVIGEEEIKLILKHWAYLFIKAEDAFMIIIFNGQKLGRIFFKQ